MIIYREKNVGRLCNLASFVEPRRAANTAQTGCIHIREHNAMSTMLQAYQAYFSNSASKLISQIAFRALNFLMTPEKGDLN